MNPTPLVLPVLPFDVVVAHLLADARLVAPPAANASWLAGFSHPAFDPLNFAGLVVIGFAAGQLGGRSRWGLLLMIAALLAFGLVLGTEGAMVPAFDTILLTTALCLGLLILGRVHLGFAIVASIAGAFALFHGIADGAATLRETRDLPYAGGYALGTLAMSAIGVATGLWARRLTQPWWTHLNDLLARHHLPHAPHSV